MIEPLVERVCARGVDVANFLDKRCVVEGHYAVLADWALMQNVVTAFVPARKLRKLQRSTVQELFALEYGTDTLSMHADVPDDGEVDSIVHY